MAAANSRLVPRSVASDHNDQRLRPASVLVMANATTPWKRAWEGQRWLKMWESFQSAATGAAAVIRLARVSRPRPASRPTLEAAPIMGLLLDRHGRDLLVLVHVRPVQVDMMRVTPTRPGPCPYRPSQELYGHHTICCRTDNWLLCGSRIYRAWRPWRTRCRSTRSGPATG